MSTPAIRAGLAYFSVVFATGFALGTLRVLWLVPRLGERLAELAETPLMLLVSLLAARWVVRRFAVPDASMPRLQVGLLALALLVCCELTVVLAIRGLTFTEYLETRDPVSGTVYLASLALFAVLPALVGREERAAGNR